MFNASEIEIHYKSKVKAKDRTQVRSSKEIYEVLKGVYDFNKIEHKEFFYAMYLNNQMKIIAIMLIGEGGVSCVTADPKLIIQGALKVNATQIVLTHNHPSGGLRPSQADKTITDTVKQVCKFLDMILVDHVILTSEGYYSFADEGEI